MPPGLVTFFLREVALLLLSESNKMAEPIKVFLAKLVASSLDIPKLIMTESAQRFYYGQLARGGDMERLYNNSYRTLFLKNLQLVQLIDYNFDEGIEVID